MAHRRFLITTLAMLALPAIALAEEAAEPARLEFSTRLIFWTGALIVMALVARVVFREQLTERRTLRRLIDEIGPYFPEFDIDTLKRWVFACAPHVWSGWKRRDLSSLDGWATDRFFEEQKARFEEMTTQGHAHDAQLEKVLKVHPLGMYPIGDGPPPRNVEIMLRLEQKAVDCVTRPDGTLVDGKPDVRHVEHFWTLRHDGHRWRLDRVWAAQRGEDIDLTDKPMLPPVGQWRRPETD